MNKRIGLVLCCCFSLFFKFLWSNTISDSLKLNRYKTHISSLDYISRQTDNSKYFLNLANDYTDSILAIDSKNSFALDFKNKISLTLETCDQNMNHRIELFSFFSDFPDYMGLADDPIEYAYDDAIEKLLSSISQTNITSIIVRESCDDEMFEIVNQILIKNTNHYILPFYEIEEILGKSEALNVINGNLNDSNTSLLCDRLELDRLGIFRVNNIDVINNSIWLVQAEFETYHEAIGFSESIFTKGFCLDKRNINLFAIFFLILESILLISLLSFMDQKKKLIKIYYDKNTSTAKTYLGLFANKVWFISNCFAIPLVLAFIMIYAISFLMPNPEDHYLETSSIIWIVSLTLVMSIIPTLLNILYINRLDFDGFHSIKGYRYFFNSSLYASYSPVFIFFVIQFDFIPRIEHFLLILITLIIADLLARSYYQYTTKSIHKNLKTQSIFGLILGILALCFFNTLLLSAITIENLLLGLFIVAPIGLTHYLISKRLKVINENKLKESQSHSLIKNIFISAVIDPIDMIYNKITSSMSKDKLNIMIMSAPMGIGKTASLLKTKKSFEDAGWYWCCGDCDEIQAEGAVSFEPFIEAFRDLLSISEFSNRHEGIESQKSIITSAANIAGVNTDFIPDFQRGEQKPMIEICIDIIDKLEALEKKTVFIMEDLHWVDPESYSFLKQFIQTVNNNKFLKGNLCIILTLRRGAKTNYRGVTQETLISDLEAINGSPRKIENVSDDSILIKELLSEKDFNLFDFVKHLNDQNNEFKIQSYSMNQVNTIFNEKLKQNSDVEVLTPLYIIKVIEAWIDNGTLKYSPDGYLLTKMIGIDDLPNSREVDGYYHSIFDLFEPKWQRVLESAAIIGNKFDADILAKVWGYELLDILAFLEIAVKNNLLKDLTSEDNMYEFADKRIITAIKSYFITSDIIESDKQIVREYNKRYISLHQDLIENSHLYSVEELLRIVRRVTPLVSSKKYSIQLEKLILEIVIRHLDKLDFQGLKVFSDFFKDKKGLKLISYLIESIAIISNDDLMIKEREDRYENVVSRKPFSMVKEFNFEIELLIILKLYYKEGLLNKKELDFINKKMESHYREIVLLNITIKISNQKSDFKYSFNLLEKFLEKNKNSIHFDSYNRRIKTHFLWKHSLNNLIKVNEKKYRKGSANSHWGTWPESVKELSDQDIIKKGYLLLENSNDAITNESIIALLLMIFSNLNMKNETIKIYSELSEYIPNESQNLKLIVGLKIRLLANEHFLDFKKETQNDIIVFVEKYIQKRYDTSHFNKFIELYIINKLSFYKKINNLEEYKILLDSYLQKVESSLGIENRSYASVCSKYSEYFETQNDFENELIWLDKRLNTFSIFSGKNGVLNKMDKSMVHVLSTQFILKSYKNSILLDKAKLYAEQLLISSDESDKNSFDYGDSCVLNAFVYEKLKEYSNSAQYFDKAAEYFESSNAEDKEWRVAFYSLRSSLNLVELDRDIAISKLKVSLDNILSDKFKNIRADRHAVFIKKAQLILRK